MARGLLATIPNGSIPNSITIKNMTLMDASSVSNIKIAPMALEFIIDDAPLSYHGVLT